MKGKRDVLCAETLITLHASHLRTTVQAMLPINSSENEGTRIRNHLIDPPAEI